MIRQLSQEATQEVLSAGRVGRLGCVVNGDPYVVPINYLFDGECVYMHSLPGLKVTALRAHPRACLQVDASEDAYHWRSVQVFGPVEEVRDQFERAHFLGLLLARFPNLTPVESTLAADGAALSVIVLRLRCERLSGLGEA
jgi:hypothetical protein